MTARSRQIRIAALGSLFTLGSTALLTGSAGAAAAPKPKKYHGHVHVDKGVTRGVNLYRECSARIRPHKYDPAVSPAITVTATGKKPTATSAIDLNGNAAGTSFTQSGQTPFVVDFDAIKTMVAPHGKYTVDSKGKIHNDLHWHIKVVVTDNISGKNWKKDIKVFNCDPSIAPADLIEPGTDIDEPDENTIPGDLDENDNEICDAPLFGAPSMGLKNGSVPAGDAFNVHYLGQTIDEAGINFVLDGAQVETIAEPLSDGTTNYWYVTSRTIGNGRHTVSVDATDAAGNCGQQSFTFQVNNSNIGTT